MSIVLDDGLVVELVVAVEDKGRGQRGVILDVSGLDINRRLLLSRATLGEQLGPASGPCKSTQTIDTQQE